MKSFNIVLRKASKYNLWEEINRESGKNLYQTPEQCFTYEDYDIVIKVVNKYEGK